MHFIHSFLHFSVSLYHFILLLDSFVHCCISSLSWPNFRRLLFKIFERDAHRGESGERMLNERKFIIVVCYCSFCFGFTLLIYAFLLRPVLAALLLFRYFGEVYRTNFGKAKNLRNNFRNIAEERANGERFIECAPPSPPLTYSLLSL